MAKLKISKKISTALINSLGAGVVPRVGVEHIAVGREKELQSLLKNLDDIAEGVAAFRFIIGNYGSGKSFLLQLIRNRAMEQGFVVADADLSPERRLAGSNNEGLATYRELMSHLATKTRPDGGALVSILEGWINKIQQEVVKETELRPNDDGFDDQVESKIREVVQYIEDLVHGFDFGNVIIAYWRGYRLDDDNLKNAAMRWLRGEFTTKIEAKAALGVRVIIDDDSWYDYIKLFAKFVAEIGYKGLLILVDEAVHLYQISTTVTREKNYNRLLAMFNDTMQCKAEHLGILIGGTTKFLEDPNRGLFADQAWRRRTKESRFVAQANVQEVLGPVIRLNPLSEAEILTLLQRLAEIHALNFGYQQTLTNRELKEFVQEIVNRLGAEALLTPGEIVRDFMSVLNILFQNPGISFKQLIHDPKFKPTVVGKDADVDEDNAAEFSL
ncbi:biotin carboxylase [Nostoc linckia z18]|uniref:Biotin carboxylase n=2 Tax=Nostoc linckia TaxID=92942 RepID=A0A9Q6EHM1_NOSLI|nr:ATP-binding protein [Nostoc linckia]PHK27272.1 biotin carboxylase [Nostoc linckia z15]PHK37964.1 biotin carboxylase [Nostoc linckia z16]PHJ52800.1 biotin carboxylase [Nostoc linckia z1]PHJ56332.1 biotin carboxylase [Nostoc linckia z2]PHJ69428.1 biotin carboxylase [Nostoc linckia z3]